MTGPQLLTLREAREQKRPPMTQEDLASKSGVDQTYISLIERGRRCPSDDIKKRLAKALGIAPSRLQFATPEPNDIRTHEPDRAGQIVCPTDDRRDGRDRRKVTRDEINRRGVTA